MPPVEGLSRGLVIVSRKGIRVDFEVINGQLIFSGSTLGLPGRFGGHNRTVGRSVKL
jgi:hypothetical protein